MNWSDFITLDRRSKKPLVEQVEDQLKAAIHDELLFHPDQRIMPEELAKQINLLLPEIITMFQRLATQDYLRYEKRQWRIASHFFLRYHFTRPFALKNNVDAIPFQETILDKGWMRLPSMFLKYVKSEPPLVYHIRESFSHRQTIVGIADTYYLLPPFNLHQSPSPSMLQDLYASIDDYDRDITIIPSTLSLNKIMQQPKNPPYYLQGMYGLMSNQRCLICGTMTTLLSYSYRNQKQPLSLTYLF